MSAIRDPIISVDPYLDGNRMIRLLVLALPFLQQNVSILPAGGCIGCFLAILLVKGRMTNDAVKSLSVLFLTSRTDRAIIKSSQSRPAILFREYMQKVAARTTAAWLDLYEFTGSTVQK